MKTARILCGLAGVLWLVGASAALAQRMQFATPVQQTVPSTSGAPSVGGAPPTTYAPPPSAMPYSSAPGPSPYGAPAAPPLAPSGPAPSAMPPGQPAPPGVNWGAPAASAPPAIYAPQAGAPPPGAALNGTIQQPPPPNWDPYATPGCGAPSPLLSQDPCLPAGSPQFGVETMHKFLDQIDLDFDWFVGHGDRELGIDDVNLSATFAFPLFHNTCRPLLVTPGFAVHYWEGPVSVLPLSPADPAPADLPPRTYDAYLDFAWNPQVNEWFGAELDVRTGIYSDFTRVTSDSIRLMGKGLAVLRFSPSVSIKAGVWYLDRVKIKLLPAGGIVWTPTDDWYFDILFPNPEVGKRLTISGNTQWWLYARGLYGGGTWTIKRDTGFVPPVPEDGKYDRFDYNDIEVAVGLRFKTLRQLTGCFEAGFSCSRELIYQSGQPSAYYPNNTMFLGARLAY